MNTYSSNAAINANNHYQPINTSEGIPLAANVCSVPSTNLRNKHTTIWTTYLFDCWKWNKWKCSGRCLFMKSYCETIVLVTMENAIFKWQSDGFPIERTFSPWWLSLCKTSTKRDETLSKVDGHCMVKAMKIVVSIESHHVWLNKVTDSWRYWLFVHVAFVVISEENITAHKRNCRLSNVEARCYANHIKLHSWIRRRQNASQLRLISFADMARLLLYFFLCMKANRSAHSLNRKHANAPIDKSK